MLRKGTFILMKTKIQDMTSGSPGRLIILFAIPLMLGNICQQLYTCLLYTSGEDVMSLCKSADMALYKVKQNGKADFKMKGM